MQNRSMALDLIVFFGNQNPNEKQIALMESILLNMRLESDLLSDNKLTRREVQCLYLACCGCSSAETAEILKISKKTVESFRGEIKKKLSCKNLIQAVVQALKYGWIAFPP